MILNSNWIATGTLKRGDPMTKVWIVNKAAHDHSDAQRFGKIDYLSEGSVNRYSTNTMFREFYPKLKESSPDDYILPTGLTIMSNIACAIFASIHGRLNLLIYKASRSGDGHYVERKLVIREEKEEKK